MTPFQSELRVLLTRVLSERRNMPDVADARYTARGIEQLGFEHSSEMFVDSFIVEVVIEKCIESDMKVKQKSASVRLHKVFGEGFGYKYIRSKISEQYGLVAIYKVSTPNIAIVSSLLTVKFATMAKHKIYLQNYDITIDCKNVSSRNIIYKYLLERGVEKKDVVDDLRKSGSNCISWFTKKGDIKVKNKIYNKFIQLLESGEVRNPLSSKLSEFVMPTLHNFGETLYACRNSGLTRIELTVHSSQMQTVEWNSNLLLTTLDFMNGCRTFATSYEKQWMALVDKVSSCYTVCIYVRQQHTLAYCHWFNSITSKKQGIIKKLTKNEDPMVVVANLSFNNRPTLYQIYDSLESGLEIEKVLRRVDENITIVPSQRNSFWSTYPTTKQYHTFKEMGLVNYKGMHIGWIDSKQAKSKICLSEMSEVDYSAKEENINALTTAIDNITLDETRHIFIKENTDLKPSLYRVAYNVLQLGNEFTVTHYALHTFRGYSYFYLDILIKGRDKQPTLIRTPADSSIGKAISQQLGETKQQSYLRVISIGYRTITVE
ncbi:hypothetical protein DL89DRAFT_287072 [Linderina pennispora]|uniref:Uncharacterized protein n=1 Tax=Linderina pennispora TaxID=61395 RepID=A0A1Y1VVX0_9FUNG|nr:uncharacterized protein DL89DRAFT_287072 [Linderina pennispora]ORX65437.1 hypothetical protein DL89DRAFT_287072 [Linderina pennispora]